ncbi:NAD(P)-dependent malic enzyme [Sulfurisphaera tokodaii]|uniref:Malate dehydrogenase n=2 Tax=Sulfurisphaera tokodaii TaxID=111955 RepID=F9VMK8_SULTO|nr:NADP-dependent malic enzyme [Sulfurisphaera tokodaii]BAK54154.1 malate dehydrogenase [Sulfurisphaera tokodaii str. 7]HII74133.1 NADP-dependent malic enzyme [Sulfurisphaera tokodaii]
MAISLAKKYQGKLEIMPKIPIRSYEDFALIYTPGVAELVKEIQKDENQSFELTSRWNTIAILTDGSRVLGLGNVGPIASLPVMEGKALLFKFLGGVDAFPLPIKVSDKEEFIQVAKAIEPAFGGINLEDIESPKCFFILEELQKTLNIPVWHDDQQGTAGAVLAGLINAIKITGKDKNSKIVLMGAGAANIATAQLLIKYGFNPKNMILIDKEGPLYAERGDVDSLMFKHPWKYELAIQTNSERVKTIEEAFKGADILIAASSPEVRIDKKLIRMMNKPIVFALANPIPEIYPNEAKEAGAVIVATGRSDFPNQVNNSLIFPAVFRGVLDSRAKKITDEMIIAAAEELAKYAEEKGLREDYIIPRMDEIEVYYRMAAAVATKAVELGYARLKLSYREFLESAKERILRARRLSL